MILQYVIVAALISTLIVYFLRQQRDIANQRLILLLEDDQTLSSSSVANYNWKKANRILASHNDILGKAGLIDMKSRKLFCITFGIISFFCVSISISLGASQNSLPAVFVSIFFGIYISVLLVWISLRQLGLNYQRKMLFSLPLTLESLILLVETGLGILPAIENLVRSAKEIKRRNPVIDLLSIVYEFSSNGMELSQALELVANASPIGVFRHALLHLDLSGNEGGEIIPSLRSLSDHTHKEWKLSVEHRVRRLENLVVFPVFISVIGLLLLTAAVPLVPVMELRESLKNNKVSTSGNQSTIFNKTSLR